MEPPTLKNPYVRLHRDPSINKFPLPPPTPIEKTNFCLICGGHSSSVDAGDAILSSRTLNESLILKVSSPPRDPFEPPCRPENTIISCQTRPRVRIVSPSFATFGGCTDELFLHRRSSTL
ncbi:hypothetical protein Fcan01_23669 [Folsomia candida]|uniref:Uncharacterized protein n=1 Tax=Folsomia candida TaxID=158441 RepID=A0A226D7J1_FOLCA|nr:hypothetical protein Fcan01_23669 [Folsomia candida]